MLIHAQIELSQQRIWTRDSRCAKTTNTQLHKERWPQNGELQTSNNIICTEPNTKKQHLCGEGEITGDGSSPGSICLARPWSDDNQSPVLSLQWTCTGLASLIHPTQHPWGMESRKMWKCALPSGKMQIKLCLATPGFYLVQAGHYKYLTIL